MTPMRPRAFTLLELLLAVAITAVVAGMLLAVLRSGFTASGTVARTAGGARALLLGADQMERMLLSAAPPRGLLAGAFVGDDASGTASDTVAFTAVIDSLGSGWGDLVRVSYFLEDDTPGSRRLVQSITRNLLSPGETTSEDHVLCRGIDSMELRYFDGSGWFDTWDSTLNGNLLPEAVEITLTQQSSDESGDLLSPADQRVTRMILLPGAIGQETTG